MENNSKIVILTDSATCIARNEIHKQPISVINFGIVIDNQTFEDLTDSKNRTKLIDKIDEAKDTLSTTQTSKYIVEKHLQKLLSIYEKVIYFCISPRLSGQYSSIKVLELLPQFKDKLFVIPCFNSGIGQRVLVFKAAQMACSNHSSAEIIQFLQSADKKLIWTGVLIGNLINLRKSGRMKFIFTRLLERVNLKLLITLGSSRFLIKRTVVRLCDAVLRVYNQFCSSHHSQVKLIITVSKSKVSQVRFQLIKTFFKEHKISYEVTHLTAPSALVLSGTNSIMFTILAGSLLDLEFLKEK